MPSSKPSSPVMLPNVNVHSTKSALRPLNVGHFSSSLGLITAFNSSISPCCTLPPRRSRSARFSC
eukprot:12501709-Heterocapsa_arctica.AAC.1